jgi:hypothetical protein
MKIYKVHEKLFDTEVRIVTDCTVEEFYKYLKKLRKNVKTDGYDATTRGMFIRFNHVPRWILWVRKLNKSKECLPVLAHELIHLCVAICEDRGVPIYHEGTLKDSGDETLGYLYEWFFKEILNKL